MDARREVTILVGVVALVALVAWALSPRATDDAPRRAERPSPALSSALRPVVGAPPKPRVVVTPVSVMPCPFSIAGVRLGMSRSEVERVAGKPHAEAVESESWEYYGSLCLVAFDGHGGVVTAVKGYVLENADRPIFEHAVGDAMFIETTLRVHLSAKDGTEVRLSDGSTLSVQHDEGALYYFWLHR